MLLYILQRIYVPCMADKQHKTATKSIDTMTALTLPITIIITLPSDSQAYFCHITKTLLTIFLHHFLLGLFNHSITTNSLDWKAIALEARRAQKS